jgi:hypothetical protein
LHPQYGQCQREKEHDEHEQRNLNVCVHGITIIARAQPQLCPLTAGSLPPYPDTTQARFASARRDAALICIAGSLALYEHDRESYDP